MAGPEQRTAFTDGNAGYVSAPSITQTARRSSGTNKQLSGDDLVAQQVGKSLGNAFEKYVEKDTIHLKEQQRLAGVAKAGMEKSLAEVDVDVKQSKFTDYIFGEDVEYRAAQQQVITNGVEAAYREELSRIDDYQGYTEREYGEIIKTRLDNLATQYKDDPETKALATDAFIRSAGRLVDKQHKTHFAFKQNEMSRIERETTKGRMDQMNIEEAEVNSPQDEKDYNFAWDKILSAGSRPSGMTEIAKKSQLSEVINETLAGGNITPYKQARIRGFWKSADAKDIAALDTAVGKYDTKFNYKVNTTLEQTQAAIEDVVDPDDADDMIDELEAQIDTHETRQSGSARGSNTIAEARSRAAKMRADARKAGVKAAKKDIDLNNAMIDLRRPGYERGAAIKAAAYKKPILDEARNKNFEEDVGSAVGYAVNGQEAAKLLLTDENVGRLMTNNWKRGDDVIPVLQGAFQGALQSIESHTDPETGFATENWRSLMNTLGEFDRTNSPRLVDTLGAENYKRFKMYEAGTQGNRPMAKMLEDANRVLEGEKNRTDFTNSVFLGEGINKREYIIEKLKLQGMSIQDQTRMVGHFDEGMNFSKGDPRIAVDYVNSMYRKNEVRTGGITIPNAKTLSAEIGGYEIKTVLEFMQSDQQISEKLLRPFAAQWDDTPGAINPTEFGQIPGLTLEPAVDYSGLWMSSPSGKSRLITTEQLQRVTDHMEETNRRTEREAERMEAVRVKEREARVGKLGTNRGARVSLEQLYR